MQAVHTASLCERDNLSLAKAQSEAKRIQLLQQKGRVVKCPAFKISPSIILGTFLTDVLI